MCSPPKCPLSKFSKGKYSGPATYTLPNGMVISSVFNENKPTKDTILIDVLDKLWCGNTETKSDSTYLLPENELYLNIDEDRGKGVRKVKPKKPAPPTEIEGEVAVEEEEEKIVFAKSTKTRNSLNFEDSTWFKRYANFKKKHDAIKEKIEDVGMGALEEDETKWWTKYEAYKKRRKAEKRNKADKKLEESAAVNKESNPPVVVFYSSKQPGESEESQSVCEEEESKGESAIELLYKKLKGEKEEQERLVRQKFLARVNGARIYDRKLDETKNPNCSCGKRVCKCFLQCD